MLLRALILSALTLWMSTKLLNHAQQLSPTKKNRLAYLLLLLFVMPSFIVSYSYRPFFLELIHLPLLREICYGVLLIAQHLPLSCCLIVLLPPAITPEALHLHNTLANKKSWLFYLRAHSPFLVTFLFVSSLLYGEFNLASLLGIETWTITLFDSQAGGLALEESFEMLTLPLITQLTLIILAVFIAFHSHGNNTSLFKSRNLSSSHFPWPFAILCLAVILMVVLPITHLIFTASAGFKELARGFSLGPDYLVSVLFALSASFIAWALSRFLLPHKEKLSRARLLAGLLLSLPGLSGALMLSLCTILLKSLLNLSPSPFPLLAVLTVLVFPWAFLMRLMQLKALNQSALHIAEQHKVNSVLWKLSGRPNWVIIFILFTFSYYEIIASSLLSPAGMSPVFVKLYNFAHYGHSAVLSAMFFCAFLIPIVLYFSGAFIGEYRSRE